MATIQQLKDYLADEEHRDLKEAFEEALADARTYNVPEFDPIETVDDLLDFFKMYLKWVPSEEAGGGAVYLRICVFYFVLDRPRAADPNRS